MQKIHKTAAILYLCIICFNVNAQDENGSEKKNIFKINLSALAFKNISLQYERGIGKRTSLALNVHTIPFSNLSFQNTFKNLIDNTDVQYDQLKLGSFGIVPELRYYVGKKGALQGFYIGPFLSYSNYKLNLPVNYSGKTGIFDGDINSITGGLQLGTQFNISKNITLDWWILGPNYGSANGTLNLATTLNTLEQTELSKKLEQLKNDVPLNIIRSYTVNSSGASIIAKGPWAGLRGLGFNFGFRF